VDPGSDFHGLGGCSDSICVLGQEDHYSQGQGRGPERDGGGGEVEDDFGGIETSRHQGFQCRGGIEEVQFVVEVAVKGSRGRSRPQRVFFPHTGRRRAVFSKGCARRVRTVGPHECRGLTFRIHALTMARWPRGHMPRSSASHPRGRAEPAPPGGCAPKKEGLMWYTPECARGGFVGGTRSPRPCGKAGRKPRHIMITRGKGTPGGLME